MVAPPGPTFISPRDYSFLWLYLQTYLKVGIREHCVLGYYHLPPSILAYTCTRQFYPPPHPHPP